MADGEAKALEQLRSDIDALDQELLRLINARARLAIEVGQVKRASGGDAVFYRPEREAVILKRTLDSNPGPLPAAEAARLMREIMSTCLALEHPLRVAYLGPDGTYTHLAALKHFGGSITGVPLAGIDEVMREVESGGANYGVVPVENSIEGGVAQTLDALRESSLKLSGEIVLTIHHQLLSRAGSLADITHVYAHNQALAQCRRWLVSHLPHAECVPVASNAEGARRALADETSAAIAGERAAEIYAIPILHRNIEDEVGNTTRFVVVGRDSVPASGADVTSVMFTTPNRPGALHEVLSVLAEAGISMTRIESRPLREAAWDYVFFVDLEGHVDTPSVAAALTELQRRTSRLKILGSYPRAVL
jgi:chorismate mutase/prephenate dehydratase